MFTTMRHYRCDPGAVAEMAHTADEVFADRLAEEPGFVAYEIVDIGDGRFFTISVFTDRESAERSNDLAAEFVRNNLSHLDITRELAATGEVVVNRARSEMMEMVHA